MSDTDTQQDVSTEDDEAQKLLADAADSIDNGQGADGDDDGDDGDNDKNFDKSRAQKKIAKANSEAANLRKRVKELEPLANKAKELEDAKKSESEKLTERLTVTEKRALEAEHTSLRLEVALDNAPEGMTLAQVRKLAKRLSGSTREELESDAEELFADFVSGGGKQPPSKKPAEDLKGGGDPDKEPEPDADKIVDAVINRRRGF